MDYKAMWEELKSEVKAYLRYYKDGSWCSWGEAVHGESHCKEMIEIMKALEKKHST